MAAPHPDPLPMPDEAWGEGELGDDLFLRAEIDLGGLLLLYGDVEGGHETRRFVGHSASVWSVALSPNGKQALSGSMDTTVRLWDVESGRELRRFDGHEGLVTAVAFSADGKTALSAGYDHQVILWDLVQGKEIRHWSMKYVQGLRFAPAGPLAAIAAGSLILLAAATALAFPSALDVPRNSQAQVSAWPLKRPNAKTIASSNISNGVSHCWTQLTSP